MNPKLRRRKRDILALIFGDHCWLCHKPIKLQVQMTIDHVKPRSKGGSNHISNLRLAHHDCNCARGDGPIPTLKLRHDMRLDTNRR